MKRCPTCKNHMVFLRQESEYFTDEKGVVRFRTLSVYKCINTSCGNNDEHKYPA